jgi:hypothetical protein
MNLCAMAQLTCPMCGSRFRVVRFLTKALVLQEQERIRPADGGLFDFYFLKSIT